MVNNYVIFVLYIFFLNLYVFMYKRKFVIFKSVNVCSFKFEKFFWYMLTLEYYFGKDKYSSINVR